MSNATFNGVVSNVEVGETITKMEIAWLLSGTDADAAAAVAAGRTVTWNAGTHDAEIAAFQAAGQLISVGTLTTGATYTPAIRVTKQTASASLSIGAWCVGDSVLNSVRITADFNSATLDAGFASSVAGVGTVTSNSPTGKCTISTPSATAGPGAIVLYNSALPSNKLFKIRIKGQFNATVNPGGTFYPLAIHDRSAAPVCFSDAANEKAMSIVMSSAGNLNSNYRDTGSTYLMWSTADGTWATGNPSWNNGVLSATTDYVYEMESNATNWRFTIYAADGTTIIKRSNWVLWSGTKAIANQLWVECGNYDTRYPGCNFVVDSFNVELL